MNEAALDLTDSSSGGQNGSTVSAKHHDNRCWPTERTVGRIYNADRSEYVCIKQSNFDNVHKDGWWIDGSTMTSTAWLIAAELSSNQGAGDSVTTAGAILSSRWMEMIMNRRTNNHKGTTQQPASDKWIIPWIIDEHWTWFEVDHTAAIITLHTDKRSILSSNRIFRDRLNTTSSKLMHYIRQRESSRSQGRLKRPWNILYKMSVDDAPAGDCGIAVINSIRKTLKLAPITRTEIKQRMVTSVEKTVDSHNNRINDDGVNMCIKDSLGSIWKLGTARNWDSNSIDSRQLSLMLQ
jgi:hypothetical protein